MRCTSQGFLANQGRPVSLYQICSARVVVLQVLYGGAAFFGQCPPLALRCVSLLGFVVLQLLP